MKLADWINALPRYRLKVSHLAPDGTYVSEQIPEDGGNLYGSECDPGIHLAMFDVDIQAMLIPSKTPGHSHLYFDRRLTWKKYKRVMDAMAEAGLVDKKWVEHSKRDKQSFLKVPLS